MLGQPKKWGSWLDCTEEELRWSAQPSMLLSEAV